MLAGALQWADEEEQASFIDENQMGEWARVAVDRAVAAKVISGYPDGSFRPQADITLVELDSMDARAAAWSSPNRAEPVLWMTIMSVDL